MQVFCATDKGKVREINEDSYYMPSKNESFAAVADGMGGHLAGEKASRLAVETLEDVLSLHKGKAEADVLRAAFEKANRNIFTESKKDPKKRDMGTTLTVLWFAQDKVLLGHVGDSRAYLVRNGKLKQISTDHSYVQELINKGIITPEKAATHPMRNVITRSVGPCARVDVDIIECNYEKNDVWLLCTDGLTRYVDDKELETEINKQIPETQKIIKLISLALERGGGDNITAMLITEGGSLSE